MNKTKEQKRGTFSLKSACGCWKLIALCLCVILFSSCIAHLISTNGGSVKISRVAFDARGATMDADLYYPRGTTDADRLPAVVVTHGAGCTHGVMRGIAQELARRGFVVLDVSAYGAGLSEFPARDEIGMGEESYNARETPGGLLDALNFLRTFEFVDQNRIGMVGHSQGSRRTSFAGALDCGYLTFNDIMVNVLHDTFGQEFSALQISQNADTLAAERLNADQLIYYNALKEEKRADYDAMLKALCLVGGDGVLVSPVRTVQVAGHDVQRNCQVNLGFVIGDYDFSYVDYISRDTTLESWHTSTAVVPESWYIIDDAGQSSLPLGNIFDINIADSPQLQQAVQDRATRIVSFNPETHSKNFFSNATTTDVVKFFEQTLSYNCGELTAASTLPVDAHNIMFMWRALFNGIAMTAMLAMLIPLAGLLIQSRFFAPCVAQDKRSLTSGGSKRNFWLFGGISVVFGFAAIYGANALFTPLLPSTRFLPLFANWYITLFFLSISAAFSAALLAVYWLMDRRKKDCLGFAALNLKLKAGSILKTLLLAVLLLCAGFAAFRLVDYLFNEDFRLWVTAFTSMKVEYWGLVWRYSLITTPFLLVMGATINYTVRQDIPEWKNTLFTVAASSAGIWICYLVNNLVLSSGGGTFSGWESSYSILFLAPVTTYIARKMYRLTNSIWLGAFTNSLLISWTMISSVGYGTYIPQTLFSSFFSI